MNVNPAEKYAALKLLESGLKEAMGEAKSEALAYANAVGAASLNTDWGKVSIATEKFAPRVADEAGLLDWVKANFPSAVRESVNPQFVKTLLAHCEVDDSGDVYNTGTGERLPFLGYRVTGGYPSVRLTAESKSEAAELVADRAADLLPKGIGRG